MYQVLMHEDGLPQSADPCLEVEAPPVKEAFSGCRVARSFADVLASWRLVYRVYRGAGLVEDNPWGIHTCPQMVHYRSVAVQRWDHGRLDATISAVADGPDGLPLDTVYRRELDALRSENRRLIEVGQFAHEYRPPLDSPPPAGCVPSGGGRLESCLAMAALTELTGYTFQFGQSVGGTDFVIGVHPRHARFYIRAWGFEPFASERTYPTVNNRPVVALRANWRALMASQELPHGLRHAMAHRLPVKFFLGRCGFDAEEVLQSDVRLADYLRYKYGRREMAA
jgi:hypothetical protein